VAPARRAVWIGPGPNLSVGRITAALRAAIDSGNLTQEQAAVLRQRAVSSNKGAADPKDLALVAKIRWRNHLWGSNHQGRQRRAPRVRSAG
jgi:hypothetical protein